MLRIYLTDLAAYNSGYLIGEWISLPVDADELRAALSSVLKNGQHVCKDNLPHEEYFITDSEWSDTELFEIGEYEDVFSLNDQLNLLDEEGLTEYELKAIGFLLTNGFSDSLEEAIDKKDEVVIYENSSMSDIAYDYVHECYDLENLPPLISSNIDFDAVGRELEMDGSFFHERNDIYEYRN